MKGQGFPWSRLVLVVLVFAVGFVMHDIRANGSFKASSVAHVLHQSGMMSVSQQAWNKIALYSYKGYSWMETNTPYYYSEMVNALEPVLEMALEKTTLAVGYIAEMCSNQITWVKDNAPRLIEWLNSNIPDGVVQFIEYLKELLLLIHQNYLQPAMVYVKTSLEQRWQQFVKSCKGEVSWPCVQDHLVYISMSTWTSLQNTTIAVKNWAFSMLSRL